MHSFHRSRGKIVIEVLCAFGMSASFVGAWMQTDAWGLLAAASVAAFYGIVHAFDLRGRKSPDAANAQESDFPADQQRDRPVSQAIEVPTPAEQQQSATENTVAEATPVKAAAQRADRPRRPKAPRKTGARRASPPKEAKVAELAPPEEVEVAEPMTTAEVAHLPLSPLFEPEPFVRLQQRTGFGRKAG